ncbi:calcium homeostasis modulator protein 6-like [Styela clava]
MSASPSRLPHAMLKQYLDGARKTTLSPILKATAFLAMALLEKIFVDEIFRCPCRTDTQTCLDWNFLYSLLFFLIPAFSLYLLSLAQDNGVWNLFMGICRRKSKKKNCFSVFWCCCCCALDGVHDARGKKWFQANAKAFAVIIVWFALSLFDGDYGACAVTCIPYTENCTIVSKTRKDQLPFSETYQRNKEKSQIIGQCMIFGVALVYLSIVCCNRCWYNADYNTYVIVDNYLKIKEDMISKDIRKILEEKLKTAMPELQNKQYYKDAIKNIKEHEDNYNDDNHIAVNIAEWETVSTVT